MQPLIPPPPPTLGAPPPLPQQLPVPPPPLQSPAPPPAEKNIHHMGHLPRPVGDETVEAFMKFNPYKLTIFEMFYLGLIVVGGLIWIAQIIENNGLAFSLFAVFVSALDVFALLGVNRHLGRTQ